TWGLPPVAGRNKLRNPLGSSSITKWISPAANDRVPSVEKIRDGLHDLFGLRSDQLCNASSHGFGTLRCVSQDENRLVETRRLFLHTAGVRQDQVAALHKIDKLDVIRRRNEMDVLQA